MRRILLLLTVATLFPHDLSAQEAVTSRVQAIRQAIASGDHGRAVALADTLHAIAPEYPNAVYARALALAAAGRDEDAIDAVRVLLRWDARFAQRALQDSTLMHLRERMGVDVDSLAARAELPIARGHVWATVPERDLILEGTAWDPATRSLLIGSLHKHKVIAVAADGTVTDRVAPGVLRSVVGIHVDSARGVLWVNSTPRYDQPADTTTAALFAFEAATGAFLRRIDAPSSPSFLNDLTTGSDGTVYVTDSRAARVLVLRPGADELDELESIGPLHSPNGITISQDGRLLFVADLDHVQVLSLDDDRSWRLDVPDSISVAAIDGLAYSDGALVAHHPGAFRRIARYNLDAAAERVVGVDYIERNTPDTRTSTTGEVVGEMYYYIGNGQIDRMNAGTIDASTMDPIRIYRAPLQPGPDPLVAVSLSARDSVAVFDGMSLDRTATFAVGSDPHEIAPSGDGGRFYIANAGDSTITVLDVTVTPHESATWRLPDGIAVHDIAVDEDGTVWAAAGRPPTLLGIDATNGRVLQRHTMQRDGSWMVDARGPDNEVVVANLDGGAITLLDPATGRQRIFEAVVGEIDAAATPDGSHIWSVNAQTGDLTIFDARSGDVVHRWHTGGGASRLVFLPDARSVLVVHGDDANVVRYDIASRERTGALDIADGPKVVALRSDGRLAWITHPGGALTLIDVPSLTVLRHIEVEGTPDGVAVAERR